MIFEPEVGSHFDPVHFPGWVLVIHEHDAKGEQRGEDALTILLMVLFQIQSLDHGTQHLQAYHPTLSCSCQGQIHAKLHHPFVELYSPLERPFVTLVFPPHQLFLLFVQILIQAVDYLLIHMKQILNDLAFCLPDFNREFSNMHIDFLEYGDELPEIFANEGAYGGDVLIGDVLELVLLLELVKDTEDGCSHPERIVISNLNIAQIQL